MSSDKGNPAQDEEKGRKNDSTQNQEYVPLKVRNGMKEPELCMIPEGSILLTASQEMKASVRPVLFEEAIARTGHGKFHYLLLFTCGICFIAMFSELLCPSYLMPAAECDFDLSSSDKGLLSAISYIGMIASSHLWGYLADTRGRRRVLLITLLLDFACAVMGSFAHDFWLFVVFRFFNGFFICGPSAIVYVYLGEFQTLENRSRAIMWACVFISVGVITLPALAWLILTLDFSFQLPWCVYNPWRLFVVLCGVPSLVAATILWFCLPESPKFYIAVSKENKALNALKYVYTMNRKKDPENYPVRGILRQMSIDGNSIGEAPVIVNEKKSISAVFHSISAQTIPLFKLPYLPHTLLCCFLQFGLYASFNSFLLWLPDLFNRLSAYSELHPNQTETVCEIISLFKRERIENATTRATAADLGRWDSDSDNVTVNSAVTIDSPWYGDDLNSTVSLFKEAVTASLHQPLPDNDNSTEVIMSCDISINPSVFQNTIIIGLISAVGYLIVAQLVNHMEKKKILSFSMVASGCTIFGMYFVHTSAEVLALSCVFVTFPGMCVSVLNSIIVEIFPTNVNAMAVCLSLMTGRLGTALGSVMLGALLEISCTTVLFVLGGLVTLCGSLALLLPTPKVTSL